MRRVRYRVAVVPDDERTEEDRIELENERTFRASLKNVQAADDGGPYSCPCGRTWHTLPSRCNYDLCTECDWEDHGQDH